MLVGVLAYHSGYLQFTLVDEKLTKVDSKLIEIIDKDNNPQIDKHLSNDNVSSEINLSEGSVKTFKPENLKLSAIFQSISGEEFATLQIISDEAGADVHAVVEGSIIEFDHLDKKIIIQILQLDHRNRQMSISFTSKSK